MVMAEPPRRRCRSSARRLISSVRSMASATARSARVEPPHVGFTRSRAAIASSTLDQGTTSRTPEEKVVTRTRTNSCRSWALRFTWRRVAGRASLRAQRTVLRPMLQETSRGMVTNATGRRRGLPLVSARSRSLWTWPVPPPSCMAVPSSVCRSLAWIVWVVPPTDVVMWVPFSRCCRPWDKGYVARKPASSARPGRRGGTGQRRRTD